MLLARLLTIAFVVAACTKRTPQATTPVSDPVPMTESNSVDSEPMLAAYERARALLAADSTTGLSQSAHDIEAAARTADIKRSAAKLAAATSLDDARDAFGEVSRQIIALLASDPALAKGQHVFECPMVKGRYNKWVQPNEDLQNPYMGKRMLACGGESSWK